MASPTLRERIRYGFDLVMARGTWALIAWHFILALAAVLVISLVTMVLGLAPADTDGEPIGFGALVWEVLMHALTPSTVTSAEGGRAWRGLMMTATVTGLLLVGSLVGVLVSNVKQRFDSLREGRSRVLERDHTLIIGWSRQLLTIVAELAVANQSRKRSCVVIYADHDKLWMEHELRTKVRDTGTTRVVVRAGDPTDPATLDVVSPEHARSLIVLAPEDAPDDTQVVRGLLALGRTEAAPGRAQHVVTEIRDPGNVTVARLTSKRRTEVLLIGELIAKIAVQTCLQAGLSVVYEELLSFRGNEIYFVDAGPLAGRSFGEALQDFARCTLIGLRSQTGEVELNPAMDRVIALGEHAIVIALDDALIRAERWTGAVPSEGLIDGPSSVRERGRVRVLILGCNARVPAVVAGIDAYVAPGSEVWVVGTELGVGARLDEVRARLGRVELHHHSDDISDRAVIEALASEGWDHVMVLPEDHISEPTEADARVLVALLHLRDLADDEDRRFSVVSEMRDVRSRDLAEVARADDFIISDRLIGLLLAQVAESADLGAVFSELFDPGGAEIYLCPAREYVELGAEVAYRTIVEAGRRRGQVVLGFRVAAEAHEPAANFGVRLNPSKSTRLGLAAGDCLVVLGHGA